MICCGVSLERLCYAIVCYVIFESIYGEQFTVDRTVIGVGDQIEQLASNGRDRLDPYTKQAPSDSDRASCPQDHMSGY